MVVQCDFVGDLGMSDEMIYEPNGYEQYFHAWVKDVLKENVVTVVFLKKDGTKRTMRCTLRSDIVEKTFMENKSTKTNSEFTKPQRKKSVSTISVYDLDNKAWRSFSYDSVMHINIAPCDK